MANNGTHVTSMANNGTDMSSTENYGSMTPGRMANDGNMTPGRMANTGNMTPGRMGWASGSASFSGGMATFGTTEITSGYLLVHLRQAKNIRLKGENGGFGLGKKRADHYAKVWLGSISDFEMSHHDCKTSKTVRKAQGNPVWDESFEFHIEYTGSDMNILYISLHNKHFFTADDVVGNLMIDIPQVLARNPGEFGPYVWYKVYYKKKRQGKVELSLSLRSVKWPKDVGEPPMATGDEPKPVVVASHPLPARERTLNKGSYGSKSLKLATRAVKCGLGWWC